MFFKISAVVFFVSVGLFLMGFAVAVTSVVAAIAAFAAALTLAVDK